MLKFFLCIVALLVFLTAGAPWWGALAPLVILLLLIVYL